MIIEHVEALRSWLTDKLRPICDADPSALAKYVVALIKKEKPLDELVDVCNDQLDVFLANETKGFVAGLFEALESKSYLPNNSLMIQPAGQVPEAIPEALTNAEKEVTSVGGMQVSETLPEIEAVTKIKLPENEADTKDESEQVNHEITVSENIVESKEKDNILEVGSGKGDIDNKDTDVDREHPRSRRHWRREKDFESSVEEFLNAKKPKNDWERAVPRVQIGRGLPPNTRRSPRRQSPGRRHRSRRERRRRSEERRGSRKRTRCRDYDEKGFCLLGNSCPYDHGRDPVVVDDTNIPNILGMQGIPPALAAPPPPVPPLGQIPPDVFQGMFQLPATSIVVNPVASIQSSGLSLDTGLKLVVGQQRPVPTASELPQNLQMLSQPQPALTTIRPLLEEGKNGAEKKLKEKGVDAPNSGAGSEAYNPEEPSIGLVETGKKTGAWPPSQEAAGASNRNNDKFDPAKFFPTSVAVAGQFLHRMYTPAPAMVPTPPLAGVSLPDAVKSILQRGMMASQGHGLPMAPPFSVNNPVPISQYSNAPTRRPFMNQTILEIRKIPKDSNTVVRLSEYFQKFGSIVNIQVNHENDPQAALIQFATNAEARRAYNSPEAVLGNRFIKLFWHNKTKNLPMSSQGHMPAADINAPVPAATVDANAVSANEPHATRPKLPTTGQTTYVNPQNTPEALQKKQAEMKKEALKKKLEIQKQRRLLLEKQIKEQKVLITKLEKTKNMSASEKQLLMTALKTLTISIEKLRTDLESQTKACKPLSKQDMQKELLDRDIELYNKQFSGDEAAFFKGAGAEPPIEGNVHMMPKQRTPGRGKPRGRGRGAVAGRGRGFNPNGLGQPGTKAVVDNRPKQILVSGFEEKDKQAVVAQFASHGEIDKVDVKPGGKLVLSFHTRKQAEIAATKAALFNGKRLVLAWYTAAAQLAKRSSSSTPDDKPAKVLKRQLRNSSTGNLLGEEEKGDDLLDDLEGRDADLFLLEEDEEEDEERSWKR